MATKNRNIDFTQTDYLFVKNLFVNGSAVQPVEPVFVNTIDTLTVSDSFPNFNGQTCPCIVTQSDSYGTISAYFTGGPVPGPENNGYLILEFSEVPISFLDPANELMVQVTCSVQSDLEISTASYAGPGVVEIRYTTTGATALNFALLISGPVD